MVNDVLFARLPFHNSGLAILRFDDYNVLRGTDLLHRLCLRLPA